MREAMYGWLDRWLRDKGDGRPVPEPAMTLEDSQTLRCYPDGPSRPKTIVTIPEFALREGRARLAELPKAPDHPQHWEADAMRIRGALGDLVGPTPAPPAFDTNRPGLRLQTEPGIVVRGQSFGVDPHLHRGREVLILRHEGEARFRDPIVSAFTDSGRGVITVDLRATGRAKPESGTVHGLTDHNEAEWALWIGRPMLGQWVRDTVALIDANGAIRSAVDLVGSGPFGLVALIAAGLRPGRVERVGLVGPLVSFVGLDATPWAKLPMGLIVPGLLETADVGHLAALIAPAKLVIAGGVEPSGEPVTPARLAEAFAFTRSVYTMLKAGDRLTLLNSTDLAGFSRAFAS